MNQLYPYMFAFLTSFTCLFILRKVAKKFGLVDNPNERKFHQGAIPLVGGLAIYLSILVVLAFFFSIDESTGLYLCCAAVLVVLGALDDYFDVSFKVRLLIQGVVSLMLVFIGGLNLENFGYLMGNETFKLGEMAGAFITVIAVIAAINAFNMVDGIDGLLGGLASVTFTALGFEFYANDNLELASICLLIVSVLIPYIMLNLGFPLGKRFKVFMGDAGSMFIGFTVVWMLIRGTQESAIVAFKPVTALWLIAIPLMDMATIMVRRIRKGQSPFKPDREHLHHICQRIGLSPLQTLVLICFISSVLASVGIWSDRNDVAESTMFIGFLVLSCVYFLTIKHICWICTLLEKLATNQTIPHDPDPKR